MPGAIPYTAQKSPMGLISMILGIVSIVCVCGYIGWLMGIVAIVLGVIAKKDPKADQGMATAGIITGIVGLLIGLAFVIFVVAFGVFGNGILRNISPNP